MTVLTFEVSGIPGAQGSKRHVGHGVMVESSAKVKPWRSDVKAAAEAVISRWEIDHNGGGSWAPFTDPVWVDVVFHFARPKSHYRTGVNSHLLRDDAPTFVTSRAAGDIDKLVRSSLDALTAAGIFLDDSLVTSLSAVKQYCDHLRTPGAYFVVRGVSEVDNS